MQPNTQQYSSLPPTCAAALKNKLCPDFGRLGICKRADRCWYSHDVARFAGISFAESAPSCESWRKTGECSTIATCWFAHHPHVRGGQLWPPPSCVQPQHSSSSNSMNSTARSINDPPSLGEHSSKEMIAFLEQHISRTGVLA
jgi:hypothetical protein